MLLWYFLTEKKSEYLLAGNGTIHEFEDIAVLKMDALFCVLVKSKPPEYTIFACCFLGFFKTFF